MHITESLQNVFVLQFFFIALLRFILNTNLALNKVNHTGNVGKTFPVFYFSITCTISFSTLNSGPPAKVSIFNIDSSFSSLLIFPLNECFPVHSLSNTNLVPYQRDKTRVTISMSSSLNTKIPYRQAITSSVFTFFIVNSPFPFDHKDCSPGFKIIGFTPSFPVRLTSTLPDSNVGGEGDWRNTC